MTRARIADALSASSAVAGVVAVLGVLWHGDAARWHDWILLLAALLYVGGRAATPEPTCDCGECD